MSWEIVIGIETHAQLSTTSKIFSAASTAFGAAPNTEASAVDIALPGVLPRVPISSQPSSASGLSNCEIW